MDNERMGRMVLRWGQIALAAAGLALEVFTTNKN